MRSSLLETVFSSPLRARALARPLLVAAAAAAAMGCAQPSPEQRVEALRAQYDVQLTSFAVHDQPQAAPLEGDLAAAQPGEEAAPAEAAAPAAPDDAAAAVPEAVPTVTQLVLDILVTTEADEGLPGLTVELEQVGQDGKVKMQRALWLDVSQVRRGSGAQITHVVEDVEYQEGDAFAVSIRSPVPPAERAAYSEFGGAVSGAES